MLLVGFQAAEQSYAIPSRDVIEVIPRVTLRTVPHAPPTIAGLFTYRGSVAPVVDMSRLLGEDSCPDRLSSRILMVRLALGGRDRIVGLLAERVTDVISHARPVQPSLALAEAPYLGGVIEHAGRMIQLVTLAGLLSEELCRTLLPEAGVDA